MLHVLLGIRVAHLPARRTVLLERREGVRLVLSRARRLVVPCGGLGLRDLRSSLLAVEGSAESGAKVVRCSQPEVSKLEIETDSLCGRCTRLLCPLSALSNVTLPSTWLGLLRNTALCRLLSGPERRHQRGGQSSLGNRRGCLGLRPLFSPDTGWRRGWGGCRGSPGGCSRRHSGLGRHRSRFRSNSNRLGDRLRLEEVRHCSRTRPRLCSGGRRGRLGDSICGGRRCLGRRSRLGHRSRLGRRCSPGRGLRCGMGWLPCLRSTVTVTPAPSPATPTTCIRTAALRLGSPLSPLLLVLLFLQLLLFLLRQNALEWT